MTRSDVVQRVVLEMESLDSPRNYPKAGGRRIHRLRAEQALGKPLPPKAEVHHADGTKRVGAQLVICQDSAYHHLLHMRMRVKAAGGNPNTERICVTCKAVKAFEAFPLQTNGVLRKQCRVCARAYAVQNHALTMERQRHARRAARGPNVRLLRHRLTDADIVAIRTSRETREVLGKRYGVGGKSLTSIRDGRLFPLVGVESV